MTLIFTLKTQIKSKLKLKKKEQILKIRAEINEMENRKKVKR